ncbi:MAG TPA: N-6 DNA methylase, partial [Acidimicrobiia bacterium]|nr:N-6 DNA methylase [Acidimicrobiia bacterium]
MQEFLNRSDEYQWGIVSNGRRLRLLRDNASLTRSAYVEFDLEEMLEGEVYSDFVLLWLTCHASRLEGPAGKQLLERWREEAARQGVRAMDALRDGVERAIEALGSAAVGHPSNHQLRHRLETEDLDPQDLYRQLLRVVYRILFLLVTESRDLLLDPDADPTARQRYHRYYSVTRLRNLAETTRGSSHTDLWRQLQVVSDALESRGEPALGLLPLGGFLWAAESTEALNDIGIPNSALLDAIRALTTVKVSGVVQRVDYANLGSEELGSIYESLLELHPEVNPVAGSFNLTSAAGNERKTTGSYYTPTPLIDELLNSALDPVLDRAAKSDHPEAAILDLKVVDPAAGSGHFLIAAANRIANRLARVRAGEDEPSPEQLRTAIRDVIGHCIYAVDANPMAVELAKVALWLEATEPGKPLSFLDHHIVCGNSLLGTTPELLEDGVPDDAFKALTGDDNDHVKELRKRNRAERKKGLAALPFGDTPDELLQHAADALAEIDALDDTSLPDVEEKRKRYEALLHSTEQRRLRLAADAWVAAFVAPKTGETPAITHAVVNTALGDPDRMSQDIVDLVESLSTELRFHHWHLAFPDVFTEERGGRHHQAGWFGGFDVVLGNPPWERVKLQEKEFFASSAPEIAKAPNKAARTKRIDRLRKDNPGLWESFQRALHRSEAISHFLRRSGVYPLCGRGDVNTYTVFAEGMRTITGPAGRTGVIVPTGIATDDTTKHFFADLVETKSLVSLFDFENRKAIFPGVHRSYKFCLLTLSGTEHPIDEAEFCFFALDTGDLSDAERRFTLTPEDFRLLNPNTRTCPIFRTRRDAEITKGIYRRVPVLVDETREESNPWVISFQRMFDMANDAQLFRTQEQLEAAGA